MRSIMPVRLMNSSTDCPLMKIRIRLWAKILISVGIAIFGMNPFGWRIMGTLFGIAMLPFLYLLWKKMTGNTPAAALACFLFAFDFMHFTQTRIATIDVYITFFVIAMYYFMYSYCSMSFYDTPLHKTFIPLGLCGVCMGLGIASKWTGVYAGCGLALLFFAHLLRRYREYLYAKAHPGKSTNGIDHKYIVKNFPNDTIKTIDFCLTFFVLIPAVIYLLSYLAFVDNSHPGLFDRMLANRLPCSTTTVVWKRHIPTLPPGMSGRPWYVRSGIIRDM